MKPHGPVARLCLALVALPILGSSCAIYDGGGGPGEQIRKGGSAEVVERQVTLLNVQESQAQVKVGRSTKTHNLPKGHYVPVDLGRGLVLVSTDTASQTARITGFRITRTLNPYQPF